MITPKHFSVLLLLAFFVFIISCKKETLEQPQKAELKITFDADSIKSYSITGCDEIEIDSIKGDVYTHLIITGCSHTFRDSIESTYYPDWYYNCYPMYDSQGVYLYDDCYWEYY